MDARTGPRVDPHAITKLSPWPCRAAHARPRPGRPTRSAASSTSASPRWPADPIRKPTWRTSCALADQAASQGRRDHLHAGAVPLAVLLPGRKTTASSSWPRPIPGPQHRRLREAREEARASSSSRRSSRSAPPGLYHNTAAVIDADGSILGIYRKMHIPDDPLYYEKFYFTPGDTGLPRLGHEVRQDRRADLLGPVVSRRRPADRAAGRRDPVLPHRHRLASRREGGVRHGPARVVGADPAQPRRRQRLLRRARPTASATRRSSAPTASR